MVYGEGIRESQNHEQLKSGLSCFLALSLPKRFQVTHPQSAMSTTPTSPPRDTCIPPLFDPHTPRRVFM